MTENFYPDSLVRTVASGAAGKSRNKTRVGCGHGVAKSTVYQQNTRLQFRIGFSHFYLLHPKKEVRE